MSKKGKFALAIGTLALLLTAGWGGMGSFWGPADGTGYRTARAERGSIATYVPATGTLNPVITAQVGTQVSGTIAKLFTDFNAVVSVGDECRIRQGVKNGPALFTPLAADVEGMLPRSLASTVERASPKERRPC